MELYVTLILLFFVCCFIKGKNRTTFYICCGILLFLACFRDATVGIDHSGYIYNSLGKGFREEERNSIEVVWGCLNSFFKNFQIGPLFTVVTSLLILIPLFFFINRESNKNIQSLILFILIPYGFCFYLTGIRQSLATSIIVWSYYCFVKNKFSYSIVLLLLAAGIHASAFFVLPFLLLYFVDINRRIFYISLIFSAVLGFLFRFSIFDVLGYITPYVSIMSLYEGYESYNMDGNMNLNGLISVIMPQTVFALAMVKYGKIQSLYTKLFCCGVIGTNLFANIPMIGRYFMYFTILQVVLIPNVFNKCSNIFKVILLLTIVYMFLIFYSIVPESTGTENYKLFF